MSGYGSIRAVRNAITEMLTAGGREPSAYNIAGIARDAFTARSGGGYSASLDAEAWPAAVDKHRRPFGLGDLVRVEVTTKTGHTELHYGKISQFRKANGGIYRGRPVKPHSVYVELDHHTNAGWLCPLTEVTPAIDDFEVTREWSEVHQGCLSWDSAYRCLRCGSFSYKSARVMAVHRVSGQRVRLCEECFTDDELGRLGHEVMFYERNSRQTITELTENPELIAEAASDSYYGKSDGEVYREWADAFPWMVPVKAAELYAAWKEQARATAGA
ncbi:hypothetical protein [Streptomyces sp. Wb2n-11]|uniref:hypothetical protein n=1 Tax=Streptomyces sp. Wb2n-11 TaxID=1030533 RepID=UPI000AF14E2B|nr:hypothetical protein [Streptomyces sp. Wb2n-11]